ncbi:MAG: BON domain-containing protein [Planctomycetaceae bacterium]|nr:BON domain-containing protein [Planctomycetaceae bacterium]
MKSPANLQSDAHLCLSLIRQMANVVIQDLNVEVREESVVLTGRSASWHGKQMATTAARQVFPDRRIDNQLQVVKPR